MSDELLTLDQVAAVLKIGRTSVYELLNSGALPSVTIGRSRRVLRSDLDAYIARLRSEAIHA